MRQVPPNFRAGSFWRTGLRVWRLQTRTEKQIALGLMLATLLINLTDMAALGAVLPLINVVVDPGGIAANPLLGRLHALLGSPDTSRFIAILGIAVTVLLTVSFIGNGLLLHASRRFGVRCQDRLGREMFRATVDAPFVALIGKNTNALVRTLVNDVLSWNNDGLQQLIITFAQGTMIVFGIGLLVIAAPAVGLIAILVIGIAGGTSTGLIAKQLNRISIARRRHDAEIQTSAYEVIAGIKDVKLSTREPYFIDYFIHRFHSYGRAMADLRLFQMIPQLFMMWIGQVGMIVVVFAFWLTGFSGGEIAAQMALVLLVTSRVIPAAIRFSNAVVALWKVEPHIDGIRTLQAEMLPTHKRHAYRGGAGVADESDWERIVLTDVCFSYPGTERASLSGISLEIEKGKSYGIAGPSGAGKSTLVDILLGLLEPESGSCTIEAGGRKIEARRELDQRIGYVPQEPLILDASLRANIAFGVPREDVDDAWIEQCLELAHLKELVAGRRGGLDEILGDRGTALSGGQKQRVAIARALYDRPSVLIFDEATSSLDGVSERQVLDTIRTLSVDLTTIMIAHRLSTIRDCDVVYLLDNGALVGRGTFDELSACSPLFAELLKQGKLSDSATAV
jgi:ABC-type multidrug transport system fused ATPase/permease subunit